jgi:hypothetical protein
VSIAAGVVLSLAACTVDGGELIFRALLLNDLHERVTVYWCETSACEAGHLSDPQDATPGASVPENQSSDGGAGLYLIVGATSRHRRCLTLEFHQRLDNVQIPMSDAQPC